MGKMRAGVASWVWVLIILLVVWAFAFKSASAGSATRQVVVDLSDGWRLLKEGEAEVTIQQDAMHPGNSDPHLLYIEATKTAARGKGRGGAVNSTLFPVEKDGMYDITFTATTRRGSVGLVFSIEAADGKVLARTTLPEIGLAARALPTTEVVKLAGRPWNEYVVALHVRDSDKGSHLVITPIEPVAIWLDHLTLTQDLTPQ